MLKQKLQELSGYDAYSYAQSQGVNPGGFWDFWETFRLWLRMRPQRTACLFCGTVIWVLDRSERQEYYCSQNCHHYGPADKFCPDCGGFVMEGDHATCIPF